MDGTECREQKRIFGGVIDGYQLASEGLSVRTRAIPIHRVRAEDIRMAVVNHVVIKRRIDRGRIEILADRHVERRHQLASRTAVGQTRNTRHPRWNRVRYREVQNVLRQRTGTARGSPQWIGPLGDAVARVTLRIVVPLPVAALKNGPVVAGRVRFPGKPVRVANRRRSVDPFKRVGPTRVVQPDPGIPTAKRGPQEGILIGIVNRHQIATQRHRRSLRIRPVLAAQQVIRLAGTHPVIVSYLGVVAAIRQNRRTEPVARITIHIQQFHTASVENTK